jgi:hypothetical protein
MSCDSLFLFLLSKLDIYASQVHSLVQFSPIGTSSRQRCSYHLPPEE